MIEGILKSITFSNPEGCTEILQAVFSFMEKSINKGFYSKRKMSFQSKWDSDKTIGLFQEILSIKITEDQFEFPIIQDFTLVGNHEVQFTISELFFDYYLEHSKP